MKKRRPKQMRAIKSVTLAGPDHYVLSPGYGVDAVRDRISELPNLETVGIQCQTPRYWWLADGKEEIDMVPRWEYWDAVDAMQCLDARITCVIEGTVWIKKRSYTDGKMGREMRQEKQAVTRVVRIGKEEGFEGEAWRNEDVRLEAEQPRALVERGRAAE